MVEKDDRPLRRTKLSLIGKPKEDCPEDRGHHWWMVVDHCFIKGCQMGSLMSLTLGPIAFLLMRNKAGFAIAKTITVATYATPVGGLAIAGVGAKILQNQPDEAVFDRAYRLYHNEAQSRSDVFSLGGALVGAVAAWRLPMSFPGGAAVGVGLGVLAHCAYKPFARRQPEGMIPPQ